jgi:hypothetical protein
VISVLRPEAKLFGLRCLMIIGTEGLAVSDSILAIMRKGRDAYFRLLTSR